MRNAPLLTPPPDSTRGGLTLIQRNALRYLAGIGHAGDGRLFMPEPSAVRELVTRGLVEPSASGVCVGMPESYRPTELGVQVLREIGGRG